MTTFENFKNSKIGQLIRINDVDLLIELDDTKISPDFLIKEKRELEDEMCAYTILTLDHVGSDLEWLLVCSSFKEECDVMLFRRPDFFKEDKRSVIQEGDNGWLFDFDSYPQEIYSGDIIYKKKFQQEVFGDVCLIEWETDSKIVDYKLLLIETSFRQDGGGWVEFYEGRQIKETDVVF